MKEVIVKRKKNKRIPVAVLDVNGKPLIPTFNFAWVRRGLKNGQLKVVESYPIFTVQFVTGDEHIITEKTVCGIDTGTKNIALTVSTSKKVLFCFLFLVDVSCIKKRMLTRRENRRARRSKLRYRKQRFSNRKRKEGWLTPTATALLRHHINIFKKLNRYVHISQLNIEVARFDTQKLNNPEISGVEYQNGALKDKENRRQATLFRDHYTCQVCKKKSKNEKLHAHHIIYRSNGGPDLLNNLVCVCETCHTKIHNGSITPKFKKPKTFKDAGLMNQIKDKLVEEFKEIIPNVHITYGYWTTYNRKKYKLEKSHVNDSYCITECFYAKEAAKVFNWTHRRRHNRQIHDYAPRPRKNKMSKKQRKLKGYVRRLNREVNFVLVTTNLLVNNKKVLTNNVAINKGSLVEYNDKLYNVIGLRKNKCLKIRSIDKKETISSVSSRAMTLLRIGKTNSIWLENIS